MKSLYSRFSIRDTIDSLSVTPNTSRESSARHFSRVLACFVGEENTEPQLFKLCLVAKHEGDRNEESVEGSHQGKSSVEPNGGRRVTCYPYHRYDAKDNDVLKKILHIEEDSNL